MSIVHIKKALGPLVTVYIPCRNYGKFLAQCVESVHRQLYSNWELFIIDDASDDGTAVIAETLRQQDPERIKVIYNPKPLGIQRIANIILDMANGRFIVRLDADDWFDESALLLMVAKLESNARLGLVYGNYFYTDQNGKVIGVERRRKIDIGDAIGHTPPHGAGTMVRTRVLKAVGGYSEDVNAQDGWELWYKLIHRVKIASVEAPLFYYRQHPQSLSKDKNRLLQARGKIFDKIRNKLEGSYRPTSLAVIPVKESYPDFKGVPYKMINNKSLLELSFNSAQQSKTVTELAISSNSDKVLNYSRELFQENYKKPLYLVKRPNKLSNEHLPLRELLIHACENYYEIKQNYPDIVLFLSLHAPFRKPMHVDNAIDMLRISNCDSVVSVCEEREPVFVNDKNGLKLLNPGRFDDLTYERENVYRFNGAVIAVWWEVLKESSIFGENIGYLEMGTKESLQIKSDKDISLYNSRAKAKVLQNYV